MEGLAPTCPVFEPNGSDFSVSLGHAGGRALQHALSFTAWNWSVHVAFPVSAASTNRSVPRVTVSTPSGGLIPSLSPSSRYHHGFSRDDPADPTHTPG